MVRLFAGAGLAATTREEGGHDDHARGKMMPADAGPYRAAPTARPPKAGGHEPAPKGERKDDPDGQCSHFVAKAPWMAADDVLKVTATADIKGKSRTITWTGFNPKKYAHHDE